jgi:hypothetical protein
MKTPVKNSAYEGHDITEVWPFQYYWRHLAEERANIAGSVKNADDLERLCGGIIDDQKVRIGLHDPKA